MELLEELKKFGPCKAAKVYVESKASFIDAWNDTNRADWILWFLEHKKLIPQFATFEVSEFIIKKNLAQRPCHWDEKYLLNNIHKISVTLLGSLCRSANEETNKEICDWLRAKFPLTEAKNLS